MKNTNNLHQILFGILGSFLLIWGLFPNSNQELKSEFPKPGETAQYSILSPITFDIPKTPEELKEDKQRARKKVLPLFEWNEDIENQTLESLETLLKNIKTYAQATSVLNSKLDSTAKAKNTQIAGELYRNITKNISETALSQLLLNLDDFKQLQVRFAKFLSSGISNTLITKNSRELKLYLAQYNLPNETHILSHHSEVNVLKGTKEIRLPNKKLLTLDQALDKQIKQLKLSYPENQGLQSAHYEVLYTLAQANLIFMKTETEQRKTLEELEVLPTKGKVIKGMQILGSGEVVSPETLEKLQALQKELAISKTSQWKQKTGSALFILLFCFFYWLYFHYRHDFIFKHRNLYYAIFILPILQVSAFSLQIIVFDQIKSDIPPDWLDVSSIYLLQPFLLAPVLATIMFDFGIGLVLSFATSAILGSLYGYDLLPSLEALVPSVVVCYFIRNLRYRSQFVWASFLGILTFLLVIGMHNLLSNSFSFQSYIVNVSLGTLSILLSMALAVFLFLPLFEKGLRITTNLTLIELSDFNHPALKLISLEAPSTFHHSIMVGNLAEKAAESIGAHSLLVRVMALYHDIGKTIKPEFFTENQKTQKSLHANLSPQESAVIIREHVTEAFKLASKYHLPPRIIEGIPEHHGTGIIQYFYRKAIAIDGEENVSEKDFRYYGPKPQTPETAILMLADSIEAITRSLQEPDPTRIQKIVHSVIQTRLMEGELEDSQLKLSDLKKLELGFLKALEGVFHTRIAYPKGVLQDAE
jgi:putative nucleotidyltransferase with HDIG domain